MYMKNSIIVIIGLSLVAIVAVFSDYYPEGKVYDCTLAEISPDYPIEVKQECRRLLKEYNNKENLLQT
jgi:hypothetical protein